MDKFCSYCGQKVEEGQACKCGNGGTIAEEKTAEKPISKQNIVSGETMGEVREFGKSMFSFCMDFMKRPVSQVKNIAKSKDIVIGIFFLAFQALVAAVLSMIMLNKVNVFPFGNSLEVSDYISTFFKTILAVGAQFFLLVVVSLGVSKIIFKGKGSFGTLTAVLGVATIPQTLSLLAAVIIAFIFPSFAVLLMIFGFVSTVILNFIGMREVMMSDEDKTVYIFSLSYIIYLFVVYVTLIQSIKTSIF